MKNRLILVSLCLLLAGCSSGDGQPVRRTIGISVLTLTNPFFREIADNLTTEAAKHGYDVLVVSGEFDVARQDKQLKDFLIQKVDAIVTLPPGGRREGPEPQIPF